MKNVEMETKSPSTFQGEGLLGNEEQALLSSLNIYQRLAAKAIVSDRKLRAVIYTRVSTDGQAKAQISIPDQIKKCKEIIEAKNWEYIDEYTDGGLSGHLTVERNGLQSMIRDAQENKFDLIIVVDYDRFARNKSYAAQVRDQLKKMGIQTYAINTPIEPKPRHEYDPEDNDSEVIMESIADMKSELDRIGIMRRLKNGKTQVATVKKQLPNKVPYGYTVFRYLEDNKMRRRIDVDEEAAERVRFVFREYTAGKGVRKITIEMNNKGWRTIKGNLWSTRAVKYILTNAIYTGVVLWGWRSSEYAKTKEWISKGKTGFVGPGNHTPIIDKPTFLKAQEIREGRQQKAKGGIERSFGLLTGIAKCIRCGHGVCYQRRHHSRSKKNPKWQDTTTFEYLCGGYKYRGICSSRVMSATKLEAEVLNHIKNLYSHPKVQESIKYDGKDQYILDQEKEIQRLDREITLLPEKEKKHLDAYERNIESLDEYQRNIDRLREENKKNHMERDRLVSQGSLSAQNQEIVAKLVESMKDFDTFWNALQLDEKKLILRSVIREIRAGDGKVEIDFIL